MSVGTEDGTSSVSNLSFPFLVNNSPTQAIANINGSLFFQANDGFHGEELWIIPADQLERKGHHDGGDDHDDGEHHDDGEQSPNGVDRGHLAAALTSNAPTFTIAATESGPAVAVA